MPATSPSVPSSPLHSRAKASAHSGACSLRSTNQTAAANTPRPTAFARTIDAST